MSEKMKLLAFSDFVGRYFRYFRFEFNDIPLLEDHPVVLA